MIQKSVAQWFIMVSFIAAILAVPNRSRAITILSGPTFTPATSAPLAGVLALTSDVSSRVSVQVNDGTHTWERDFFDFGASHSETLLGFRPDRTNHISVTVYDKQRNTFTATQSLTFVTAQLPASFPHSTVLVSDPSRMEPGYTLFLVHNGSTAQYMTVMDSAGNVVWYSPAPSAVSFDLRQLEDGNLFTEGNNNLVKLNMLGQTVQTWSPAPGYPVNVHEGVVTDHGSILYLSDVSRSVFELPEQHGVQCPAEHGECGRQSRGGNLGHQWRVA